VTDLFDDAGVGNYSQGTSNEEAAHDGRWLLPTAWQKRAVKCPKCGKPTVTLLTLGRNVVIDVEEAYKKKGTPKGCRVTVEHAKLCKR